MEFQICTTETGFKNLVEESGSVLLYGELIVEHSSLPRTKDCDEIRLVFHFAVFSFCFRSQRTCAKLSLIFFFSNHLF